MNRPPLPPSAAERLQTLAMDSRVPALQRLSLDPARSRLRASQLLESATLTELLACYSQRFPGCDRRAVISLWSKGYFEALFPPLLAATLSLELRLPIALEDLGIDVNERGTPILIVLPDPGQVMDHPDQATQQLCQLFHDNLTPFVEHVARFGKVSARALWGNVAAYLAWAMNLLVQQQWLAPRRALEVRALFSARELPDGRANPLHSAYQFETADGQPRRKVCCLRYQLPDLPYCADCPLTCRPPRTARAG
ncbi:siderophore-iron reductase FhuF [Pseudomonas putida]|uniref:siderophore-iron reductase FhuF n=1 Tax=Pseudomonas putida TaxID=303 RepID=UPI0010596ACA|nr:siderophore-iron reductase FhuF [Pseudomonas putida]TDJ74249.1 siderophore-iron reductase FhuF [Pseudomonas putida]